MLHAYLCALLQIPSQVHGPLEQSIRASEYEWSRLTEESEVFSAPNRGVELRSRVSAKGLELFPRATPATGIGAEWKLELATKSFGREGACLELLQPSLTTSGARIELAYGQITEWFVNRPDGVKQGWTITSAPAGSEALWIGLGIGGDLGLRIDASGRSGVFVDGRGTPRLRYLDLKAWDATGRVLAAELRPSPTGVGIALDTLGAVYPLTVDPLLTGPAWSVEGNQASANFGISVSTAGDVNGDGYSDVIVGASLYDTGATDAGRAYLYLGSASGLQTSAAWTASGAGGSEFGDAVSLAGDVNGDGYSDVIVGAPLYGEFIFGWTIFGRAFLYLGSASGLSASAAWSAMGPVGSEFGRPVAGAGDVNGDGYSDVIVGAYAHTNGQVSEGRAYVYHGSASGLSTTPAWITESNQAGALFGNTVATAGDVNGDGYDDVILGSVKYDNGETDEGRAFVFHGSSTGLSTTSAWTFEPNQSFAYLQVAASAGDVNGDGFGDVVVASTDFDNGEVDEGAAWVFLGSASGLAASGTLLEANQASASFGARVASAGDLDGDGYDDVAVGIPLFDNGHTNEGQVRVYRGSSTGITTAVAFQYEPDAAESRFGRAVAGAGDVNGDGHPDLLVGAHRFTNGETNEGAAFVFHGAAGTLLSTPAWTGEPDSFGASVSSVGTAGDVNADGFDDVIWGSPFYTNNHSNEGAAFCFYGSESGPSGSPDWFFESDIDVALYGTSIACAGDVNGDGYDDLIVGAPNVGNGRAFLYLGTPTGLSLAPDWTGDPNITLAQFGFKVASAGDVDADGFGDVVVLAPSADSGQVNEGIGFVYRGSPSGLGSSPAWTIESNQDFSDFTCVACAGDVNGDGFSDIAAGYRQFDNGQSNEGRVAVFHGSSGGPSTSPDWTFETGQASSTLGELASAGDVNGDGYSDLIVGASNFDNGQNNEGRAFLFLGSPSGLAPAPAWFAEGDQADAFYGIAVGSAGDVNGDGLSDVVVGALGYDVASSNDNRGRAYLYLGNALGLSAAPSLIIQGDQNFANFGSAVSRAGDANGDGYGDVIVGAQSHDNGSTNEGRAFLYYGNENGSPTLRPRQKRATGRPLAVLDRTGPSTFQLSVEFDRDLTGVAWSRPGGSTARLQWELAPLGGTFDGIPDGESAPQTITGTTLSFDELIGGLLPDTLYHWRARIATTNPLYPNTPWFTIQGRPVTEAKFRTQKAKAQATSGTPGNGGTRTIP